MADTGLTYRNWLEQVPELLAESAEEWDLRLGEPYPPGAAGYAIRAELHDGPPAVLKLIYPHREAEHEAEALAVWDGNGAVRLLRHNPERQTILMERCEPGTLLAETDPSSALDVLIGLLPRLWKTVDEPFRALADDAAWWLDELSGDWEAAGRPFERRLLDEVADTLRSLAGTQASRCCFTRTSTPTTSSPRGANRGS